MSAQGWIVVSRNEPPAYLVDVRHALDGNGTGCPHCGGAGWSETRGGAHVFSSALAARKAARRVAGLVRVAVTP